MLRDVDGTNAGGRRTGRTDRGRTDRGRTTERTKRGRRDGGDGTDATRLTDNGRDGRRDGRTDGQVKTTTDGRIHTYIYIYIYGWLGNDVGKSHTDASLSSTALLKEKEDGAAYASRQWSCGRCQTTGQGAREPKPY